MKANKVEKLTEFSFLSNHRTITYYMVKEKIKPGPIEKYFRLVPIGWIYGVENGNRLNGYQITRTYKGGTVSIPCIFLDKITGDKIRAFFGK